MTDVLKLGKKIFTIGVVVTTIAWSIGVAALLPAVANAAVCPTLAAGDMVKVTGRAAIYSVNNALKILYFPSGDEFKSWNVNEKYGNYISITQSCFDSLGVPSTYPAAVNFRPGSFVVKRASSDQLYVVEPGNSLAKITTTDARALYGTNFIARTIADPFWPHYVNRSADVNGSAVEGMLISNGGKTWYVAAGNVLREVTATGMTANRFKTAFVRTVPASYLTGFSTGAVIDAEVSAISNRVQEGAVSGNVLPGTESAGNLTVSLAGDNPAATNIAGGSAYNSVLKLNLSSANTVKVNSITLSKTGLISNTNITGVSVWDGEGNRHGDVMTSLTSDNRITVSFGTNPILVAPGNSASLIVKVNISGVTSGLVGFSVANATDIASNGTVSGSFPINGNQMSIVDGSFALASTTITAQSVGGAANDSLTANIEVGKTDLEIAKFRFTEIGGHEDVVLSQVTFFFAGSLQDKDLANLKVYAQDGSVLGSVSAISDRYATVKFSNPLTIAKSTSKDISLHADVMDGSNHTFNVHIQNDYDVLLKGVSTGFYILPGNFSDVTSTSGWFKVKQGSLTLAKNPASPSGNVSVGAQGIVLAKFDVKAVGENMELRKMGIGIDYGASSPKALTGNLIVRDAADGTVYLTVAANTAGLYTAGSSQRNLSSYITINSGITKTLEVVGSIDSTATSGNAYTIEIGNFYAKRFSSLDYIDNLPNSGNTSTAANQITVNATSLTCYKDTSMGNVTRATGATAVIGQYICTAGTSEDVRLTGVNVYFGVPTTTSGNAANTFQNLALYDGSTQLGSTQSTVASTSNNFSFDLTVPKGTTKVLQLKAYLIPGATNNSVSSSFYSYNYTGKDSGTSGTGSPVAGQTVTVGSGALVITSVSDGTTISKIYGPDQSNLQLGKWKFSASSDNLTLNKITFTSRYSRGADASTLGTFGSFALYDGSTLLGTGNYVNGDVVFTGLSLPISMDYYKVLTLKGNSNSSGVITVNTSTAFVIKDDTNTSMEVRTGAGGLLAIGDITVSPTDATTRLASSTNYIYYDAYPSIAAQSLGTALSLDTNAQIFKFSITNPGTKDLRVSTTTVTISASGLATGGSIATFKLYEANDQGGLGTYLASTSTITLTSSTTSVVASFGPNNDQNSLLDNFVIAPGTSRTFIVVADTSNMFTGKTTGSVNVSSKIAGSTGWSGTAWNTGDVAWFFTSAGSSSEQGPFTASDSYEVSGGTLSKSL